MSTTYTWQTATSGTWATTSNWGSSGTYPGAQYSGTYALINATGATYTVEYAANIANSLGGLIVDSATATLLIDSDMTLSATGSGGTSLQLGTITLAANASLATGKLVTSASTTLNIGSGASVTDSSTSIAGVVNMAGGTLGGTSSGLTLNGTIDATSGSSTVTSSNLSGSGEFEANGGTLMLSASLGATSFNFTIGNSTQSIIDISKAFTSNASFGNISFLGPNGEFEFVGSSTNPTLKISGLNAGSSKSTPTNFIDVAGSSGVTISSQSGNNSTTGTVKLSNGDTMSLTGITGLGSAGWKATTASDGNGGTDVFLYSVCYAAGTRILTTRGERRVETLTSADTVVTLSGNERISRPIRWVGQRSIDIASHPRPETVAPIRIRRGAFAQNIPHADLIVSPDHGILADGTLICARQLINGTTIRQDIDRATVDYFHVELDCHAILLAEGLPAESYLDTGNRGFFVNANEPVILHPDLTDQTDYPDRQAASCHPFVWDEASVRPVWQRLADRAESLGNALAAPDTTTEPELCIVANGRTIRPTHAKNGTHIFALPRGATEAHVVSRAGSPTDARPWMEDRRRLGVYVDRITVRGSDDVQDIPLDHPGLSQGWWAVEQEGLALHRWTDGAAVLSLPPLDGPAILEIHATNGGMAYVTSHQSRQAA